MGPATALGRITQSVMMLGRQTRFKTMPIVAGFRAIIRAASRALLGRKPSSSVYLCRDWSPGGAEQEKKLLVRPFHPDVFPWISDLIASRSRYGSGSKCRETRSVRLVSIHGCG